MRFIMFNLKLAQSYMYENSLDAWLIYDFRGNNPVMWQIIGEKNPHHVDVIYLGLTHLPALQATFEFFTF